MSEELEACCCENSLPRRMEVYGVDTVKCGYCNISLRFNDWQRVMGHHIPEGLVLVPVEPTEEMIRELITSVSYVDGYKAMIKAAQELDK